MRCSFKGYWQLSYKHAQKKALICTTGMLRRKEENNNIHTWYKTIYNFSCFFFLLVTSPKSFLPKVTRASNHEHQIQTERHPPLPSSRPLRWKFWGVHLPTYPGGTKSLQATLDQFMETSWKASRRFSQTSKQCTGKASVKRGQLRGFFKTPKRSYSKQACQGLLAAARVEKWNPNGVVTLVMTPEFFTSAAVQMHDCWRHMFFTPSGKKQFNPQTQMKLPCITTPTNEPNPFPTSPLTLDTGAGNQ